MSRFVHLHLHSEFSMVDGIVRIKPLMQKLKKNEGVACAITDLNNLFAAIKMYSGGLSHGVKPIIGAEISLLNPDNMAKPYVMVLLCMNKLGYLNLTKLISRGFQQGQHQGKVLIKKEWVVELNEGLIALSGGMEGDIGAHLALEQQEAAKRCLSQWLEIFNNRFYLELMRTGRQGENDYIKEVLKLAEELNVAVVATNNVRFLNENDFEAHEARVCINQGHLLEEQNRPHNYTKEQYLKTPKQMAELFFDIPEAIDNSYQIAKRCNVDIELGKSYLPSFPIPEGSTIEEYLQEVSEKGLDNRLQQLFGSLSEEEFKAKRVEYDERLKIELDVINGMGFPGYFLIVADFIRWAKKNDIPVGPGRGSGAGSLVAYVLDITDLDPLEFELLFERFLNPERVSMPDFDIDFCMEGRDRVIEYVANKYGRPSVSQIITFGTLAAKAVVRDVGRVLGHPYGFVDKLAKLIPFEIGMTLSKALEMEEALRLRYENETEVYELIELAQKLEGITRNAGKHAGGVVIAPGQLTDFTAIYCEPDSEQLVTQFDKDDVEKAGLVKFDFLGLRTLTIIHWAIQSIFENHKEKVDITRIAIDDKATFNLLKACSTTAVFQLESRGMKELIGRLQPDCFEEIIALVALFRPGPLQSGMVDDFIDRKHGRAPVEYPHPDLEPILKPTYGVILYQEQVMQIAQVLAGYSLGAADLLRRAMGKKKPEEMAKQRVIFTEGATNRGVEKDTATYIFDLMEKFAGYGFNKSHSAAYALVAYQTAWLKTHYLCEFMAAVLSSDMDNTDKVVTFIDDCKALKVPVLKPCINLSQYHFKAIGENKIRFGLGGIKGVGESAIESILNEREAEGPYQSLFDLCNRVDLRKVNRRVIEALIKSGALDIFDKTRESYFATIDKAFRLAEKNEKNLSSGQIDLFSNDNDDDEYVDAHPFSLTEKLFQEKETLGLFYSGHPTDAYKLDYQYYLKYRICELSRAANKTVMVLGLVTSLRRVMTKRGKRLTILTLEDSTGRMDAIFSTELFADCDHLLVKDNVIIMEGEVSRDDYSQGMKMNCKKIVSVESMRDHYFKKLMIKIRPEDKNKIKAVKNLLKEVEGSMPVVIQYIDDTAKVDLTVDKAYYVSAQDSLLKNLRDILTEDAVTLC